MSNLHNTKIQSLSVRVEQFFKNKKPFRVFHGSTNSTRVLIFKENEMIDISDLNQVVSVNAEKRTAIIESNVSMDQLVKAT